MPSQRTRPRPTAALLVAVVATPVEISGDRRQPDRAVEHPVMLDGAGLASAQRQSLRLPEVTEDGLPVVPLMQVVATTRGHRNCGRGVAVLDNAHSVASLAIDMRLLGIAQGIVVVAPEMSDPDAMRDAIIGELVAAGHRCRTAIPGWTLTPRTDPDDLLSLSTPQPAGHGR